MYTTVTGNQKNKTMKEYQDLLANFSEIVSPDRSLTFMEICKYPGSRFEEVCSRILRFFLSPNQVHDLDKLFISSLIELIDNSKNYNLDEISIELEEFAAKKRIDLIIEGNNFVIGIENKIFAKLYNDLGIYRNKIEAYKKPKESTHGVVLTLRELSINERLNAESNGFTVISYINLFKTVKERLKEKGLPNNRYSVFLQDFIQTIENLTLTDMDTERINFFKDNSQQIEKLLNGYGQFKKTISSKQKKRIAKLFEEIKKKTLDKWWVYKDFDLGFQMSKNDYELGLESWFIEKDSEPFFQFKIMITTWKRKNWDYFQSEISDKIKKGKVYKSGSKNHLDFQIINNGTDKEILAALEEAFNIVKEIVSKKESL